MSDLSLFPLPTSTVWLLGIALVCFSLVIWRRIATVKRADRLLDHVRRTASPIDDGSHRDQPPPVA